MRGSSQTSRNPPWNHQRQRAIREEVDLAFFLTEDAMFPHIM
jgi:hypothetical protein